MAKGYLLDNNHIHAWYNKLPCIIKKVRDLPPDTLICTCAIVLGEIEAGHLMTRNDNPCLRDDYTRWVNEKFLPHRISITPETRVSYAKILGNLWKLYPPRPGLDTEKHLVQNLGVDINDVWVAAATYEHDLILVTHDKMVKIREAIPDLRIESWI